MWRILAAVLRKYIPAKQRSFIAVILLIGIIGGGIIYNWDEMIFNIKNHRTPQSPHKINVELCLQKDNFTQDGDTIIESISADVEITDMKVGISNRNPLYLVYVYIPTEDITVESIVTVEQYNKLHIGDKVTLHRTVYYNLNGWSTDTVDTYE